MAAKVADRDKPAIRDLTEEAIAGGATGTALKALRAELAELLGVNPPSLRSVSAYVEYSATEALADTGLADRLSNEQLVCAARLVRESATWGEDVASLAADHGITGSDLERAIRAYEGYYQNRPGCSNAPGVNAPTADSHTTELQPQGLHDAGENRSGFADPTAAETTAADVLPEPPPVAEGEGIPDLTGFSFNRDCIGQDVATVDPQIEPEPDLDSDDLGVRGDTANYDFESKHLWREFWDRFIRFHFSPVRLREAKVICLPGRKVEPEVSRYLKMGVRPENIFCVEGSTRVRAEFLENCQRLGVRAFPMKLEAALRQLFAEGIAFDIVNYDFHGQYSDAHLLSVANTPLSADAIVIHNAMGKRESRETQASFKSGRDSIVEDVEWLRSIKTSLEPTLFQQLQHRYSTGEKILDAIETTEGLKAERRNLVLNEIAAYAGRAHTPLRRDLLLNICEGFIENRTRSDLDILDTQALLVPLVTKMGEQLRRYAPMLTAGLIFHLDDRYEGKVLRGLNPVPFGRVTIKALFSEPYVDKRSCWFEYRSQTNNGSRSSPFYSAAVRVRRSDTVFREHDGAVQFCCEYVRAWGLRMSTIDDTFVSRDNISPLIEVADLKGRVIPLRRPLEWNHTVRVVFAGQVTAMLRASDLRLALVAAADLERKQHLSL